MEALADLIEVNEATAASPALGLTFAGWAETFLGDGSLRKVLRKPNQVGGTTVVAADAVHELEGTNPFRPRLHSGPINILFMSESFEQMYAPGSVVEKVWNLLPRAHLDPSITFKPGKGIMGTKYPTVPMVGGPNAGGNLFFRTYDQDPLKSVTIHGVYASEPMPEDCYAEIGPRLWKNRGRMTIEFTPVPNMPDQAWLRRLCEPDDGSRPVFSQHHLVMSEQACWPKGYARPFYTAEDIARFRSETPAAQRAMRFDAAWEPVFTGRHLTSFSRDRNVRHIDWHHDASANELIVVSMDHGLQPGKQAAILQAIERPGEMDAQVAYLEEYSPDGHSTTDQNAHGILAMLARRGLTYRDVDVWVGDVTARGKDRIRRRANADMKIALARAVGINASEAAWIETPNKYDSSDVVGFHMINALFERSDAIVDARCVKFIQACERFRGRSDDPYKDILDAGRYGTERGVHASQIIQMRARY